MPAVCFSIQSIKTVHEAFILLFCSNTTKYSRGLTAAYTIKSIKAIEVFLLYVEQYALSSVCENVRLTVL